MAGKTYDQIFTPEEIAADEIDLAEMYRCGIPQKKIQAELGRTQAYLKWIRQRIVEKGLITEEEIKKAQEKHKQMYPPAQGGERKNKIHKPRESNKDVERKKRIAERREKIAKLVKENNQKGKTIYIAEICNNIKEVDGVVRNDLEYLINQRNITE